MLVRLAILAVLFAFAGCGSEGGGGDDSGTTAPALPDAEQVAVAERAVEAELPDLPIWKGTAFHGVATSENEVCVDRVISAENAKFVGGNREAHVVVTLPDLETGDPLDGSCEAPEPSPDERLSDEDLDELARELLAAIEAGDNAQITVTAERIKTELDEPLPVTTKQANLIHSATVAVLVGVRKGDPNQVEAAQRFLAESLQEGE